MDDNKLSEQEILCFVTWSLYYGKPTIINILTNLKKNISKNKENQFIRLNYFLR